MVTMLIFPSCHRKEVKLRMDAINDRAAMPVLDAQEITTLISDSGVTRFRITARQWLVYDKAKPSYWEFPEGIYLEQFDRMLNTAATLRSDYAYYDDQAEIWHLTGNVYATNVNGEQFETPELYWSQKEERVYSDSSITITQPPTPAAIQAKGD
ncbi:MAG: LPS export ABC transporter periplasmic protein LptC, partial [Paludibacteraceae bacterium]|nr:LPS export ABC transporter periplasmic protein LptC [Paludibacteraceae bacterium]